MGYSVIFQAKPNQSQVIFCPLVPEFFGAKPPFLPILPSRLKAFYSFLSFFEGKKCNFRAAEKGSLNRVNRGEKHREYETVFFNVPHNHKGNFVFTSAQMVLDMQNTRSANKGP